MSNKPLKEWTYPTRITVLCSSPEEGLERIQKMFQYENTLHRKKKLSFTISRCILKETEDFSPTVPKPKMEKEVI